MKTIENLQLDEERALYNSDDVLIRNCRFDGPADGESALKESHNLTVENCYFNLRYPFWHDENVKIKECELTDLCRAALWYTNNAKIEETQLHGIKALRECKNISLSDCDIISPEFGWSVNDVKMTDCTVSGEYFMLRSLNLKFKNVSLKGKYSFQYIEDSIFEDCDFDTKDAFWHAKNVIVKNSVVKGEYLAWYCENVTFENCTIIGTQPLCYCKGLKLINCEMIDTDLSFEKSQAEADITNEIVSVKNLHGGYVKAKAIGELICEEGSFGEIITKKPIEKITTDGKSKITIEQAK